jgi:D-alanyl-D-alanine carboxypeptidase/D-alanyl-D-alanine-endopeptidase (penicillin-binding protein 4)
MYRVLKSLFLSCALLCTMALSALPPELRGASVGFMLTEAVTGRVLTAQNPDLCLTPASVMKIITTATALELLGADYRFETHLQHDGFVSADSTLHGNLYITGGGDPTLASARFDGEALFALFAKEIKRFGIRHITGNVIADASLYDKEPLPVGWTWEDIGNYYAAGVYGLSVCDNRLTVTLCSRAVGSKPDIVQITPGLPDISLENALIVNPSGGDSVSIYGMPYDNRRVLRGGIPPHQDKFTVSGDIPNPPLAAAHLLINALSQSNITVDGEPADRFLTSVRRREIYVHYSVPLAEIIKSTNRHSVNLYAEHLVKHLSLRRSSTGNFRDGLAVIRQFWQEKGLDTGTFFMLDGSGLSPHNALSVRFVNDVLRFMYMESRFGAVFQASLPVAGVSGTVRSFLKNTSLAGRAALKSGSLARVQCYAGYINRDDRVYLLTVMVNNFSGKRRDIVRYMEELILNAIPL